MKITEFNEKWGQQWAVLKKHPMFRDMLSVAILEESPANRAHMMSLDTLRDQSGTFAGSIAGFSLCLALIKEKLGAPVINADEESQFQTTLEDYITNQS